MRVLLLLPAIALVITGCADDRPHPPAALSAAGWLDTRQGCSVWDSRPLPQETADWTGACAGGRTEGDGTLTWRSPQVATDGSPGSFITTNTYEGRMHAGKNDGEGTQTFFDRRTGKERYAVTGHFRDGRLDGRATTTVPNGYRFVGDYHGGKQVGPGVARYLNGATYSGTFSFGAFDGHGVLEGRDGVHLVDQARAGGADTAHKGVGSDAYRFEGEFRAGTAEGPGTLVAFAPGSDGARTAWTLDGRWSGGCLGDSARHVCLFTAPAIVPAVAAFPPTHRALPERWLAHPIYPAGAIETGMTGVVALDCHVTTAGVAEHCDVTRSPHVELDEAAVQSVTRMPWVPAVRRGAAIDTPHVPFTVTFDMPASPGL